MQTPFQLPPLTAHYSTHGLWERRNNNGQALGIWRAEFNPTAELNYSPAERAKLLATIEAWGPQPALLTCRPHHRGWGGPQPPSLPSPGVVPSLTPGCATFFCSYLLACPSPSAACSCESRTPCMVMGLLRARLTKGQMEFETMVNSSLSSFAGNPTLAKHSLLGAFKWPPHKSFSISNQGPCLQPQTRPTARLRRHLLFLLRVCVTWMGRSRESITQNPRRPGRRTKEAQAGLTPHQQRSGDRAEQSLPCVHRVSSPAQNKTEPRESCLLHLKLLVKGQTGCLQSLFERKKNQELNQGKGHS